MDDTPPPQPINTSPMMLELVKAWLIDEFCNQITELQKAQCEAIYGPQGRDGSEGYI